MKTITTSKTEIQIAEPEFIEMLGLSDRCMTIKNVCFQTKSEGENGKRTIKVTFEESTVTEGE